MALAVITLSITATLLSGGTTAYLYFKILINIDKNSTCSI